MQTNPHLTGTNNLSRSQSRNAFTLIEMLVLISAFSMISALTTGLILLTLRTDQSLNNGYQRFYSIAELGERFREDIHHTSLQDIKIDNNSSRLSLGNSIQYTIANGLIQRQQDASKIISRFNLLSATDPAKSHGQFSLNQSTGLVSIKLNAISSQLPTRVVEPHLTEILFEALARQPRAEVSQ